MTLLKILLLLSLLNFIWFLLATRYPRRREQVYPRAEYTRRAIVKLVREREGQRN